jgi:hypothetical protein
MVLLRIRTTEQSNEFLSSIKFGEFLDEPRDCSLLKYSSAIKVEFSE